MFRRLDPTGTAVTIYLDGQPIQAAPGDSVATALLVAGVLEFHPHAVSGEWRAPFCLIGACFECLLEIDGWPDRQACLVAVADGMQVRRHGQ